LILTPKIVLIGHVCIDHNKTEHATYTGWGSSVLYIAQHYQKYQQISSLVVASYGPNILEYLPEVAMLPASPNQPQTLVYENDTSISRRIWKCPVYFYKQKTAISGGFLELQQCKQSLHFNFDVATGRQTKVHQRINSLRSRIGNVNKTLVYAHFELLTAFFVDVRALYNRKGAAVSWQWDRTSNRGTSS
jgi:hypothetical protein